MMQDLKEQIKKLFYMHGIPDKFDFVDSGITHTMTIKDKTHHCWLFTINWMVIYLTELLMSVTRERSINQGPEFKESRKNQIR